MSSAANSDFQFANASSSSGHPAPSAPLPTQFTIKANPKTDIWIKPPSTHIFNAPILHRTLPLSSFLKARVTVSGPWKSLYDQGGLCLVVPQKDGATHYIKTGVEFYKGESMASTVTATERGADWSLLPIPGGGSSLTLEMVREKDGSLWVYVIQGVRRLPVREVTWILADSENKGDCWVGVYVAKPSEEPGDLEVEFAHLIVETM